MFRHSYAIFKAATIFVRHNLNFQTMYMESIKHVSIAFIIIFLEQPTRRNDHLRRRRIRKTIKIAYKELTRKERHRFTCSSGSARLFFVKPRGDGV